MSDWDTVTVLKKRAPKASQMKSEQAVNAARRQGVQVETQQKCKILLEQILFAKSVMALFTMNKTFIAMMFRKCNNILICNRYKFGNFISVRKIK